MKFDRLIKHAKLIVPLIDERSKSFHVSYLLKRNQIVSVGINKAWHSHPIGAAHQTRFSCLHAEAHAIIKSRWRVDRLDKLTLVNLRFKRDLSVGLAKPCIPCQNMLRSFGITNIYYTLEGGDFAQME